MINEDININKEGIYNPWNPEHIININTNGIYLFIGPKKLNNEKKYIRYNIPTNKLIQKNISKISIIENG